MVRKKTKKVIWTIIGITILIFIGAKLFSIGFDDFSVEEDFSILSPTLVKNPQNLLFSGGEDRVYKDDLWLLKYKIDVSQPPSPS